MYPLAVLEGRGATVEPCLPEAKGAGFNTVATVLRSMLGPDHFAGVSARLLPSTLALLKTPPLSMQWIPVGAYADLVSTALLHGFKGDESSMVEMGRRAFNHDLRTLYKLFIRLGSPSWVIQRGPKLWLTYNRNNGSLSANVVGERKVEVTYCGVAQVYPGFWSYQRGCLLGVVQATGYRAEVTVARGGATGSGDAVLLIDWSRDSAR